MSLPSTLLIFAAAAHVLAVLCLMVERRDRRAWPWWAIAIATTTAGVSAWAFVRSHIVLAVGALAMTELTRRANSRIGGFRVSGVLLWVSYLAVLALGLPWMLWFVVAAPVSVTTKALMLVGTPLLVVTGPAMLVRTFENWEVLCRSGWTRPQSTRVSVQVIP
jgi:hypothetical protein